MECSCGGEFGFCSGTRDAEPAAAPAEAQGDVRGDCCGTCHCRCCCGWPWFHPFPGRRYEQPIYPYYLNGFYYSTVQPN